MIRSMKFVFPGVALYLYKSTIKLYMVYCFHILTGAPSCYMQLVDKLQNLELLVFHFVIEMQSAEVFYTVNTSVDVHLNWLNWFYFLILEESLLVILIDCILIGFSVTIPTCYRDDYAKSFFPYTARPRSSLPIECFLFTNDLNGFKSIINRHLLTVGSL